MTSQLDQLRKMSVVVADTGSVGAVRTYRPVDCTTNPSLVLAAFSEPELADVIAREIAAARKSGIPAHQLAETLTVAIGAELCQLVPGRVSIEVAARLSFDITASVTQAHAIIDAYAARGIGRERILIKLAATWEGIRAAEILQRQGIDCNITLVFSLAQAVAAADAGAWLISPFVGRITDWHKEVEGRDSYPPDEDPGVQSVVRIYNYFKSHAIKTIVMAASFRSIEQIRALAGCDRLTISPKFLDTLDKEHAPFTRILPPDAVTPSALVAVNEPMFRWALTEDAMANQKLAEGLRQFHRDHLALISLLERRLREP